MLRIATLNLLHDTYALDERLGALADELRDADLDFLLLQEVLPEDEHPTVSTLSRELDLPHSVYRRNLTRTSGNAVLSKHELTTEMVKGYFPVTIPAAASTIIDGREVVVISYHGAWGAHGMSTRVQELRQIDGFAYEKFNRAGARLNADTRPVIVLGGDFNDVPDSDPIRYLSGLGLAGDASTFWLDAMVHAGDTGHTSGFPSELSIRSALAAASTPRPERRPLRRIDYLFVYEWAYGQAGEPISGRRFATGKFLGPDGELTISDHYGLLTDLWMP